MIRLIATDLDGTLLRPDHSMPEDAIDTIRQALAAGIRFAACSGRQYSNLRRLFLPLKGSIAYVCENGSLTVADGEIIGFRTIPHEDAMAMIQDILSLGMELMVSGKHATCLFPHNRVYADDIVYRLRNTTTIIHSLEELPDDIIKISGYIESGLDDLVPILAGRWGSRYTATPGGPQWFDITPAGKRAGLECLCSHWNIPLEDTAAFGDSFNDESMLDAAGHPFIISSADPRMKKSSYRLFESETEEIRRIIQENIH